MQALVGIAAERQPAQRIAQGCQALAQRMQVVNVSRPWWAPAAGGAPAGLLAVANVLAPAGAQRLRHLLWDLEAQLQPDIQFELLAGLHRERLRWGVDPEDETAWIGPLSDVAPRLPLRSGLTTRDHAIVRPHPGAYPWQAPPAQPSAAAAPYTLGASSGYVAHNLVAPSTLLMAASMAPPGSAAEPLRFLA